MAKGGGKRFEVCNNCGKKGMYDSTAYGMFPPGTKTCRYCREYFVPADMVALEERHLPPCVDELSQAEEEAIIEEVEHRLAEREAHRITCGLGINGERVR